MAASGRQRTVGLATSIIQMGVLLSLAVLYVRFNALETRLSEHIRSTRNDAHQGLTMGSKRSTAVDGVMVNTVEDLDEIERLARERVADIRSRLQECVPWACDKRLGRIDCTDNALFRDDLRMQRDLSKIPASNACRSPGAAPALICGNKNPQNLSLAAQKPEGYICSRTRFGDWEFDANENLDIIIYWLFFRGLGGGSSSNTFVEFGAQNGVFASNTRFFERFLGWSGMLVEPACYEPLVSFRPNAINIEGAVCDTETITLPGAGSWCKYHSRAPTREVVATCRNIRQLVDEHFPNGVTFMSVDMEGFEMTALNQLNFKLGPTGEPIPRIAVLLVEWRQSDGTSRRDLLRQAGYASILLGGSDVKGLTSDELFWHPKLVRLITE